MAYLWGWLKVLAIAFERQDYDKFKAFLKFAWQNKVSPTGATRLCSAASRCARRLPAGSAVPFLHPSLSD